MLFHEPSFWLFFAAFAAAWVLARHTVAGRNAVALAGSYVFYAAWDWRFLGLIVFSTLLDFIAGLKIAEAGTPRLRRAWLAASVAGNLGVLAFFKYWNFFQESAAALFAALGLPIRPWTLDIILPVGISFYTFQTMSYSLDVHAGRMQPTRNLLAFAAYVAFFPQLVAGPIERAHRLLPQFLGPRVIDEHAFRRGLDLIAWGLFKKVVVADQLAPFVDLVYALDHPPPGLAALATVAFGFQIYADFSGYSDIARGLARLLGFELAINFNRPYFADSLRDFWHRWHISLSTWLRDYLYIPLGGNRRGVWCTFRNLAVTMALGGLWHGAAWHFVLWGCWHGLGLILERKTGMGRIIRKTSRGPDESSATEPAPADANERGSGAPAGRRGDWAGRTWTLAWVFAGWALFRAPSLEFFRRIRFDGDWPDWGLDFLPAVFLLIALVLILDRRVPADGGEAPAPPRCSSALWSAVFLVAVILFSRAAPPPYLYFQF